jgi:hypothetical protein
MLSILSGPTIIRTPSPDPLTRCRSMDAGGAGLS